MERLTSAIKMIQTGNVAEGLAALTALVDDPECGVEARGHRAWVYRSTGRLAEAIADYELLRQQAPENPDFAGLLAETRLLAGDAARAVAEALEALRRDPLDRRACGVVVRYQRSKGIAAGESPAADEGAPRLFTLNPVIEALEKDPRHFRASVQPEVGRLLYALARNLRPRLVVETGSFIGYSALFLAQALRENGAGHLHAFDLFLRRPGLASPVVGACEDTLAMARGHLEQAGLGDWVTFHQGDSASSIRETLGARPESVDLAFIDGDHSIRGCLRDWNAMDALLAEGGLVLLHDTNPRKGWLGPRWLLEQLGEAARERYAWIDLPLSDGAGMAAVQKRTPGRSPAWRPALRELLTEWLFHRKVGWHKGPK